MSQPSEFHPNHSTDALKEGLYVKVKLLGFDDRGRSRRSMKVVDQETGEAGTPEKKKEVAEG